jgi:hypothetical protein
MTQLMFTYDVTLRCAYLRTFSHPAIAPSKIANAICGAIPSGRVVGVAASGGPGFGGLVAGGEEVLNYNSGQTSAFGYGGLQVGCCNFLSGSVYTGFAYGLNNNNSNYSGGFTSISGSGGPISVTVSRSSNGVGEPIGVAPPGTPGAVTTVTVGGGEGVNTQVTGFGSVTTYSNPLQTGQFTGFGLGDYLAYGARQLCKAAGY